MLLKDCEFRDEQLIIQLTEYLKKEFIIFEELSRYYTNDPSDQNIRSICKNHLTMVRTFEQKNLIEEGQFINTDGVYMVFEGFCGFYEQKKAPVIKINAFGKEIL